MTSQKVVRIGCAAGFADDRCDSGLPVVESLISAGGPAYMMYEVLGERTLALAQLLRRDDPDKGYSPYMIDFLRPVLRRCVESNVPIIANFGAANPLSAARLVIGLAEELKIPQLRVGVVEGDDLLDMLGAEVIRTWRTEEGLVLEGHDILAANAYLGARPIAQALAQGAQIVITGRCTDSALALGPMLHEFGWADDDWSRKASGILAGHLLECCGHVSGGYFADPGFKDVPNLADLGFPIAEISSDGEIVITKPPGTGGLVSERTVKEQLLYEIHDPANYLTPDVTLDITGVVVQEEAPNRVRVFGAAGRARPETDKVTVSIGGGFLGEGEISYAGPNALARAELAASVLRQRIVKLDITVPVRCDIIGTIAVFDGDAAALRASGKFPADGDYRVRLAGQAPDRTTASRIAREVLGLYANGPAGGAGVRINVTSRVKTASCYVPTILATPRVSFMDYNNV
jgi:hypothetical protein